MSNPSRFDVRSSMLDVRRSEIARSTIDGASPRMNDMTPPVGSTVPESPRAPIWLRIAFVAVGLAAWFGSQALIGKRSFPDGAVGDAVHRWTDPLHDYLIEHPRAANALLITSSAVIDLVGVSLLCLSIFGPS